MGQSRSSRFKLITMAAVVALVVAALIVGGVLEAMDTNTVLVINGTCQQVLDAGYTFGSAGLVKPWDPTQIEVKALMATSIMVVLRCTIIPPLVATRFAHLVGDKQVKICNYIFETITTTTALAIFTWAGIWGLMFSPGSYYPASPEKVRLLTIAGGLSSTIISFSYLIEMIVDTTMRYELRLHHALTIMLILWGTPAISIAAFSPRYARMMYALFLFMITEQNVFLGMVGYYSGVKRVWMYKASAWFYLISRVAITILCIVSFVQLSVSDDDKDMFGNQHNSTIVFGWWAFYLPGVLVLGAVQIVSTQSLFGIARKIEKDNQVKGANNENVGSSSHINIDIAVCTEEQDTEEQEKDLGGMGAASTSGLSKGAAGARYTVL